MRMPAAKHELPKKRGEEVLLADAPGMGLPDPYAGSINWQVLLDDKQTTISLRNLADKFFDALGWHEDIETAVQPLGSRNQRNIRMTLKHSLSLATLILRLLCLAACPT